MLFERKKKNYSVLYKDSIWSLKVGNFSIIWWKKDLRKKLEGEWIFIQKIVDIEKNLEKAKSIHWNDQELFNFTNIFRLELSKWVDSVVSVKSALNEVYKKTFSPLVYSMLLQVKENRKFENIIHEYPNVFDDIYTSTIDWYFKHKHDPIEGLVKLEEYILERQKFKKTVIDKTRMLFLTIGLTIVLSYVLDLVIYEWIRENFNNFWRPLPDFTQAYHNTLYFFAKYIGVIILIVWVIALYYKQFKNENLKILLGKLKLQIPIYGEIHKKKCVYDIIDTFTIMRSSDTMQRDILKILMESANNFYLKKIIEEATEEIKWWKQIWKALEPYGFFSWADEDVIHAFKSTNVDESMISLRRVKKVELQQLVEKSLRMLTSVMLVFALVIGASMGVAYYWPVQKQTTLVKDKINADKEASLDNNQF